MGLLNRAAMMGGVQNMAGPMQMPGVQNMAAPIMQMPGADGGQFGGMLGAFAGSPQFQTQLSQIMQGQGPGHQAPQMIARPSVQASPFDPNQKASSQASRADMLRLPVLGSVFGPVLQSQMFKSPNQNCGRKSWAS